MVVGLVFFFYLKSVFIMKKYFFIDFKVLISKKNLKKNILIYFLKNILYHIIKYENLRLHKINKQTNK